jgi:hypothetical protein
MEMKFETLLGLIAKESDQEEFLSLGQQYHTARRAAREANAPNAEPAAASQTEELLDQIMKRIQWHFRAIRHPIPTRQEVGEMIEDHFE